MRRAIYVMVAVVALPFDGATGAGQVIEPVSATLRDNQFDMSTGGRAFLLGEAAEASFFMLGELHGDNETAALIRALWPPMWDAGYRHTAAEVSPWTASRLEYPKERVEHAFERAGSWSASDVAFLAARRSGTSAVLWGCDMEEMRPHLLVQELAAANPISQELQAAADLTRSGYQRKLAPAVLEHLRKATDVADVTIGGVSLRSSIVGTLEVEVDRMSANTRLSASNRREAMMKELFLHYWERSGRPKVMLRYGRNHLHRGLDRRGVSTLGNFVAELAAVYRLKTFNVAQFAGAGKIAWAGQLLDFAELGDDSAFAFLASIARYPATVFDLRQIRQALHQIPEGKRSPAESSLIYWADSYDAIIFYREVTPLR